MIFARFEDISEIAGTALQEGGDFIGISSFVGNHLLIAEELRKTLKEKGIEDTLMIFGGIIPEDDVPQLYNLGVNQVFGPGVRLEKIVNYIKSTIEVKRRSEYD